MGGFLKRNWLPTICIVSGLIVLSALGTWQVNRLVWKEALIEQVMQRTSRAPVSLDDILANNPNKSDHEYLSVTLKGEYDHSREAYFFTTGKGGKPGWLVHTPVRQESGTIIIVNRGFVPFEIKDSENRQASLVEGEQSLTGLLRFPLSTKPIGSLENDLEKKEFYWRNVSEFSKAMGLDDEQVSPIIVDLIAEEVPDGFPQGGTTLLKFSNNHLQYAVTWFGLALTLLGVGGYFLYSREKARDE